jgi:hypothetical protein
MPKGVYERKPKEPDMSPPEAATKMFPVLLNKNYVPRGEYEIVGYLKEAVKQKDSAGHWRIVEPEAFIEGEMKPHASPGVGFDGKIWAGTHIKLLLDEAKQVVSKKIAERADAIPA